MSLDSSNAYFHIPINHRSKKYLRFYLNKQTYQFTALPFGLATAPLEFTKVVKEVKRMAQTRLTTYLEHLGPVLRLGMGGKYKAIRSDSSAGFQLRRFLVRPFDQLGDNNSREVDGPAAEAPVYERDTGTVRQFMPLIGLLTAGKKDWSGCLHMRPLHPMASEMTLACSRNYGKDDPSSHISLSTSRLVVR